MVEVNGNGFDPDKEPRLRWNVKQSSKGFLYWEFTVRGDDIDELEKLARLCKAKLSDLCRLEGD